MNATARDARSNTELLKYAIGSAVYLLLACGCGGATRGTPPSREIQAMGAKHSAQPDGEPGHLDTRYAEILEKLETISQSVGRFDMQLNVLLDRVTVQNGKLKALIDILYDLAVTGISFRESSGDGAWTILVVSDQKGDKAGLNYSSCGYKVHDPEDKEPTNRHRQEVLTHLLKGLKALRGLDSDPLVIRVHGHTTDVPIDWKSKCFPDVLKKLDDAESRGGQERMAVTPPRGAQDYDNRARNQALSGLRAEEVKDWLNNSWKPEQDQKKYVTTIEAKGFGYDVPLPGASISDPRNRRVEIHVNRTMDQILREPLKPCPDCEQVKVPDCQEK